VLAPNVVDAIEELVSEGVASELADLTPNGTPWLSLRAAAVYIGVSARTVERALARGHLRSSTIGRRRLLHRDDLDAYLRAAGEE
jgi:excisionase family DNA binding protein